MNFSSIDIPRVSAACFILVLSLLAVPAQALTADEHKRLFLRPGDIPNLQIAQDGRVSDQPYPDSFPSYGGRFYGQQVWKGSFEMPIWRVVERRWTFETANDAEDFLDAEISVLSEKFPPLPQAPPLGEEGHEAPRYAQGYT